MIVHPAEQGSVEWMQARAGIPTASEFDQIITPEFKIRTGQMPATYLAKKAAESWLGGPLPSFNVVDMEQGRILEEEAIPFFELEHDIQINRVGLVTTDDGRIGCSPDGLLGEDGGIEVKCPEVHTHVGYLLSGVLPKDYATQVHGAMFVTGRPYWTFMSYRRKFPPLVLTISRDERIQNRIAQALDQFLAHFDRAVLRLQEINGGPPLRTPTYNPEQKPESEYVDLIP